MKIGKLKTLLKCAQTIIVIISKPHQLQRPNRKEIEIVKKKNKKLSEQNVFTVQWHPSSNCKQNINQLNVEYTLGDKKVYHVSLW